MLVLGGLFLLIQTISAVPAAEAAQPANSVSLGADQPLYLHAATSAEPIIFHARSASGFQENIPASINEIKTYVLGEIKKAGLNVAEASRIINCESRWNEKAINNKNRNGSNDKGLWQINSIHKNISDAEKLDYKASTQWAIAKRLNDGNWSAWSCANRRVAVAKPAVTEEPVW